MKFKTIKNSNSKQLVMAIVIKHHQFPTWTTRIHSRPKFRVDNHWFIM